MAPRMEILPVLIIISLSRYIHGQLDHELCEPLPYVPGTVGGNSGGAPCVFPFTYKGVSQNDCVDDGRQHPWCSTTANYDADMKWGNCPATTSGTGGGHRCVFPFVYKTVTYNKCIGLDHNKPWCAVTDSYDRDKKWGECPSYTSRELPDLPPKFSAKIRWNMLNDNMSMFIEEFFDRTDNIGSVRVTGWAREGQRTLFISNYDTDEFFQIEDFDMPFPDMFNCEVNELNRNLPFVSPFTRNNNSISDTMIGGVAGLKFGLDFPTVYVGKQIVDDVNVERWDACVYNKERNNATLKISYYYTDKDTWTTSSGLDQTPYRIDITGKDNSGRTDHIYQYSHFTNTIREKNIFMAPTSTICQGRRNTVKQPPTMPKQFSFTSEMIYSQLNYITTIDEWYDLPNKYFRMDFIPFPTGTSDDIPNTIKLVSDFNTGLSYVIDTVIGNCTVTSLKLNDIYAFQLSSNITRMRTPDEFFSLDKYPVYYKGKRMARGFQTDVFITTRPYPNEYAKENMAIYEWLFLDDEYRQQVSGKIEHKIPMKLVYTVPFISTSEIINFVNFVEKEPDMGIYDVSACFAGGEKRHFSFALEGSYVGNVDRNIMYFKNFVLSSIEASTNVRKIRIQDMEIDHDSTYVYLRFTILGPITKVVGDVIDQKAQVPLEDAARALENDINGGKFEVMMTINFEDSDTTFLPAVPYSLRERIRLANGTFIHKRFAPSTVPPPSTVSPTPSPSTPKALTVSSPKVSPTKLTSTQTTSVTCPPSGGTNPTGGNRQPQNGAQQTLSTGVIAGIGTGAGLLGILIGVVITYLVVSMSLKRRYDLDRSVLTMNEITNQTYS